ncbi:hypothetical protein CRYUN_Cryun13aG0010400 [Craigia yunnanensis]
MLRMMSSDNMNNSKETQEESLESNEIEKTKISLMRTLVERQDPSSKEVDDLTFRRFLRARDLDIEKASAMFLKYQKWRRNFVPNGSVSPSEVAHDIEQNKMFLQGSDKKGRPLSVLLAARHFQHKGGVEEFKRFIVYIFDKIFARMPPGQEKFVVLADLKGWGYANSDIRACLAAISFVQIVFVENKTLKSTLLEEIDESQLPETYGGKLPLVPIHDS